MSTDTFKQQMTLFGEYNPESPDGSAPAAAAPVNPVVAVARKVLDVIGFVIELVATANSRNQLARELSMLSDETLKRIGVARDQIPAFIAGDSVRDPITARPVAAAPRAVRSANAEAVQAPAAPFGRRDAA